MKIPGVWLACFLALPLAADEGMWLFNEFPKDQVQRTYGFEVPDAFLENLRLASLRIGGSSGSFVSSSGLILTHRGAVADCVAHLTSAQHDYVQEGFYAAAHSEELTCPGLSAEVLVAMEDVTGQVKESALNARIAASDTMQKRTGAIVRLEKSCAERTGNACSVVSLSSGERFQLYQYRKYTDLRLVFAPELAMATFGGDAAIFTYQRYELDIAFLRAWENGKPAETPHYLKWSAEGVKDTDLLFVAGSPQATSRLDTSAQLTFYRDTTLPFAVSRLAVRIGALRNFVPKSEESRHLAEAELSALGIRYKYTAGLLIGLNDERVLIRKVNFEKRLRSAVERDPKLGAAGGKVWDEVANAYKAWAPFEKPYQVLENPAAEGSTLFRLARQVVRLSAERTRPNEQRLPEYRETTRAALEQALYGPAVVDDALEVEMLSMYLTEVRALGDKEAPLKAILGTRTPQQAAEEFVRSTKLKDPGERKRLASDSLAVQQSQDGMIRLARLLDEPARKVLKKRQDTIEALQASASERIAQYRFRLFGAADYPDATGTLRVSFGSVRSYHDRTEAPVLFATSYGGLFHLAGDQPPVKLPPRWREGKALLDQVVPFDFVSTCDTSPGNSGSPTVNRKGELVGMVFDANLEALPSTYMYSDDVARAVHVASQGIVEALVKIYRASALLRELGVESAAAVRTSASERQP